MPDISSMILTSNATTKATFCPWLKCQWLSDWIAFVDEICIDIVTEDGIYATVILKLSGVVFDPHKDDLHCTRLRFADIKFCKRTKYCYHVGDFWISKACCLNWTEFNGLQSAFLHQHIMIYGLFKMIAHTIMWQFWERQQNKNSLVAKWLSLCVDNIWQ